MLVLCTAGAIFGDSHRKVLVVCFGEVLKSSIISRVKNLLTTFCQMHCARMLVTLLVISASLPSIPYVNASAAAVGDFDPSLSSLLIKAASLKTSDGINHAGLGRGGEKLVVNCAQRRRRSRARTVTRAQQMSGRTLRAGMWGGEHLGLNVTATRVEIEFDCAHGTIDQSIKLDREGRFDVIGTFVPEGGPVSVPVDGKTTELKDFSARYRGRVEGDNLLLKVTITKTGTDLDEMTLTHGIRPVLEKCY